MTQPTEAPRRPARQVADPPTATASVRPADADVAHRSVESNAAATPVPHALAQSLGLHLAPGVAVLAAYALLIPVARQHGLPSAAALAATGLVASAPVQLSVLAAHRRRHPHEPALQLRERLPVPRLLAWACVEIVLGAMAFQLMAPLTEALRARLGWWPMTWSINLGNDAGFSRTSQVATAAVLLVGTAIVAPIVEEVYFRGYLLPRMPQAMGDGAPVAHAALFACYHLQTPWLTPVRLFAIAPLAYIATRTRDVRIGMVTHVVLNTVDLVVLILFIIR